jgi:hypothetical protein
MRIEQRECVPKPAVVPFGTPIEYAGKIWIMADDRGQIGDPFGLSVVAQGISLGRQIPLCELPAEVGGGVIDALSYQSLLVCVLLSLTGFGQ